MTGWRLGTLMAPLAVAKAVANLQSQTSSNATTFAQYGALAAMQNWDQSMAAVNDMLEVFDCRRSKLLEGLQGIDGMTARCTRRFYLFPSIAKPT